MVRLLKISKEDYLWKSLVIIKNTFTQRQGAMEQDFRELLLEKEGSYISLQIIIKLLYDLKDGKWVKIHSEFWWD